MSKSQAMKIDGQSRRFAEAWEAGKNVAIPRDGHTIARCVFASTMSFRSVES